jgi:predicted ATPase
MDNCKHLVQSCANVIVPLLKHCRGVTILATSREPFGIEGVTVWRLNPLESVAATQLFIERARAHRADFDPNIGTTIPQLSRALDNLSPALELAAAC